ncbi:lymphotoxin-alpha-like [Hemiscyllium ocellatum]|uniref:lymphotoxin-alpha-like n=1 Tax=Hemiscyllium ocellatum TaxID=170820 RepID=UPI0029668B52|nr:lymphotoxin-alpha-like [Hemiscyllium ocellatum]
MYQNGERNSLAHREGVNQDCKTDSGNNKPERLPNDTGLETNPSPPPSSRSSIKDQTGCEGRKCNVSLPIAHIVGKAGRSGLVWDDSSLESTRVKMGFENDAIVIEESGFYYVYSQVAFVGTNCSKESLVLENRLLYKLPNYDQEHPQELLEVTESVCEGNTHLVKWQRSLRQGGVFNLKAQTLLSVKIIPRDKAEMEHHKTYFGAFKLQ